MDLKFALEQKLNDINDILKHKFLDEADIGVFSGISGIALFHFYYSKLYNSKANANIGSEILQSTIERINNGYSVPTFCSGIAGAGWVIDHLVEEGFIDLNADEVLENFDSYLYSVMQSEMEFGNYDFLHSGLGYGFYFFKRYTNAESNLLKSSYEEYLNHIVDALIKSAEHSELGYRWETKIDEDKNGFNFSLSHGMASIISFLTKLTGLPEFEKSTRKILIGAIDFVRYHKFKNSNFSCLYPNIITESKIENIPTRLGWCYGDLGIGLAFFNAGHLLNDEKLIKESLEIIENCSRRKSYERTGVVDSDICHGAFGIALIFSFFWKKTNNIIFRESSDYWMSYGLKLANYEDGFAGFKHWNGNSDGWMSKLNVLEGVAGIGLTIINYLSDEDNTWDQCLLIN